MTGAEAEEDIPLGERKTVTDFCYLLDKSKQLFNGLRWVKETFGPEGLSGAPHRLQVSNSFLLSPETCLSMDTSSGSPTLDAHLTSTPSCGSSSSSTGDSRSLLAGVGVLANTPLTFPSADRQVLDSRYGLKRWQIGEVASKIGQLYYHY